MTEMAGAKKAVIVILASIAILALCVSIAFAAVHTGIAGDGSEATRAQQNETGERDCREPRGGGPGRHHEELSMTIAETLGISTDELKEEISSGKTPAELAEEKGVSADQLVKDIANRIDELIEEDLAAGELTGEQAEEMRSHSEERARNMVERAPGPKAHPDGHGPGAMREYRDEIHAAVAELLGISTEELEEELSGEKTKAQIAEEKGVSVDQLVEVIVNKMDEITDNELAQGNLSEEQAEEMRSHAEERARNMVERAPGEHGNERPHGPGSRPPWESTDTG